jgi:beta-1,2-mannobiose phosphorylase / 1,2-beta-oligomannan phosphorylase
VAISWSTRLSAERVNCGRPLIEANPDGWDNAFTLNPTIVRLERSPQNDPIILGLLGRLSLDDPRLNDGIVAVFYRGIPKDRPGIPHLRSSVGLAVFTPGFTLLKRYAYPVVEPTDDPMGYDYNGVEDQRITQIGDTFHMIYCGYNPNLAIDQRTRICMAESKDLIHWTKLGPLRGSVNLYPNKDAVMVPNTIDGKWVMLHRPMIGRQWNFGIALAVSDSPVGRWHDLGTIMRASENPRYDVSWIGAGSVPLHLGNNRYLADYHIGNSRYTGERDYYAGFAILNFNNLDLDRPQAIVETRCDRMLEPETPYELNSPWPHPRRLDCVFPAGSFEYRGDVVLVYGGADAYVLGARFNRNDLLSYLETTPYMSGMEAAPDNTTTKN